MKKPTQGGLGSERALRLHNKAAFADFGWCISSPLTWVKFKAHTRYWQYSGIFLALHQAFNRHLMNTFGRIMVTDWIKINVPRDFGLSPVNH
jgi:hypothetical protein